MNSSTKKTIAGIGIAGAVIIAALLVYAILITPVKQPYRDALSQYKNVYNANVELTVRGSSLGASTASDEQFEKNIEAAEAALKSLTVENEALGKEAVLADGEGKSLYDAFTKKLVAYTAYNTDMLNSVQEVRPVVYACSQVMTRATTDTGGVEAMRTCSARFEALQDVPDADYSKYASIAKERYATLAENLAATGALADPEGADAAQAATLSTELQEIIATMNADGTELAKNLSTHKSSVDITGAAMALDDFLQKKSNIF